MKLNSLNEELNNLLKKIIDNSLIEINNSLIYSEDPEESAKLLLIDLEKIIGAIGKVWNEEHDIQGKLIAKTESLSLKNINDFYGNLTSIFELIRSRLHIKGSYLRIGVGTLLNKHNIAQLIELKIRSHGFLTYYFGNSLTLEKIESQMDNYTPINVLVLSIMAVNEELNAFNELKKVREKFPDLRIIVGGSAFPVFSKLKEQKELEKITNPYKQPEFIEVIKNSDSIKEFVKVAFNVEYIENVEDLLDNL